MCKRIKKKPPFTVSLMFFKTTGKFYSSDIYETKQNDFYSVVSEVREMLAEGKITGVTHPEDFIIQVTVLDKEHGSIPHLIIPDYLTDNRDALRTEYGQ